MATVNERLTASFAQLKKLQNQGRRVFRSNEFSRVHRERLIRSGVLCPVTKGWLTCCRQATESGDTTAWFAAFCEFCSTYCDTRFGRNWHLGAEQSLILHANRTVIPKQIIVCAPKGTNKTMKLIFGSTLYDLKQKNRPPDVDLTELMGLRVLTLEAALLRVPRSFFVRHPIEARLILTGIHDVAKLLERLLEDGHSIIAGRLAGALRRVGNVDTADQIVDLMKGAGYDMREVDPFDPKLVVDAYSSEKRPMAKRLQSLWQTMREPVIATFPEPPGLPKNTQTYLTFVDHSYQNDAYHALSIEGYPVTLDMINRIRADNWDRDEPEADRKIRSALSARGDWQAFRLVRNTIHEIVAGGRSVPLVRMAHGYWYRELFEPYVSAGLIAPSALTGYRKDAVIPEKSQHRPPHPDTLREAMTVFFDLLDNEHEPFVRAVLGYWLFEYIHPYSEGNGRVARFVMNAMLASGGYPWTVIQVDDRETYLSGLERASNDQDISLFAQYVANRVKSSTEQAARLHL